MLVKAIKLVSQMTIGSDERRTAMVDYIADKAGIQRSLLKTLPPKVEVKEMPQQVVLPPVRRRVRLGKNVYVALLLVSWLAFAAYLGYRHLDQLKQLTAGFFNKTSPANTNDSLVVTTTKDTVENNTARSFQKKEPKRKKTTAKPVQTASLDSEEKVASEPPAREVAVNQGAPKVKEPVLEPEAVEDTGNSKGLYKIVSTAYFHNRPDVRTRRNAFVNHWNNSYATLKALDEKNGFIYVVFENDRHQTSKGWLLKKDLRPVDEEK